MNDKIQKLLEKAEAQTVSLSDAMSSVARAERIFASASDAADNFARFRRKLFHIEKWNAHSALTSFALFDETGKECARETAVVGDFVRVTLTGSGKSDWVKITRIDDAPGEIILILQPSINPTEEDESEKNVTSHFFTSESSNNFCLQTKDAAINFYVIGVDEKTNTAQTKNVLETVRNAATANLGHYLGIQETEWKIFCENFLETKAIEK